MTLVLMIALFVLGALLHSTRRRLTALEQRVSLQERPMRWQTASQPIAPVQQPAPIIEEPVYEAPVYEEPVFEAPPPPEPVADIAPPRKKPARPSGTGFEDLFGRKLPIWAGGITLLVAAVLLVRYSIDAGLLSPIVRVVIGALFGLGLIATAEIARRKGDLIPDPRIPQALAGAGIGSLYAVTLAAADLYALIGPATAFAALAAITAGAMALTLRFGAPSALLALVGGLATPALVQSHHPNPPLLTAYIALVVGALTLLSRRQRWFWLGVSALVGGAGWSAIMIAMGALDMLSTVCVGALVLLLGMGLPALGTSERHAPMLRGLAAMVAALQLAALVATGHFAPLTWGLYGLLSIAFVWLTGRMPALRPLVALPLLTALALLAFWPAPGAGLFALVLGGIAVIYGGHALWHLRHHATLAEAGSLCAIALAGYAITRGHFAMSDTLLALLACGFAVLPAIGAALTWRYARQSEDKPFALQAFASALLIAIAALSALPEWMAPMALAVVAGGVLALAVRARNPWLMHGGLCMLAGGVGALALTGSVWVEFNRLVEDTAAVAPFVALLRWGCVMVAAVVYAHVLAGTRRGRIVQGVAAVLAYGTVAQVLPALWLATAGALMLLLLAEGLRRRPDYSTMPAIMVLGGLALLWALAPLGQWVTAGLLSLVAQPVFVTALPAPDVAIRQMLLPALLVGAALWRHADRRLIWMLTASGTGALGFVALHVLYKQVYALGGSGAFITLGMAERTLWQALLIGVGIAVWRFLRWPRVALGLIGAGFVHGVVYTVLLHDPLWDAQAVGDWPLANLLLPAYVLAFAALALPARIMPGYRFARVVDLARMVLIPLFTGSLLRQVFTGSIIADHPIGAVENIVWSLLAVMLGVGYLLWGIRAGLRDWRIASLVLMLAAVGKVFLLDASGLEGLLRIGSFLALGFSLIGIGWLYSRYLRPAEASA